MRFFILFCLALSVFSCGPPTIRDLRSEGESETRKLAYLLQDIQTKEQLQKKLPKIQQSYVRIAELMIQIRSFDLALDEKPTEASDELFVELARLYEMPGFRKLLEAAQGPAIERLKEQSILPRSR